MVIVEIELGLKIDWKQLLTVSYFKSVLGWTTLAQSCFWLFREYLLTFAGMLLKSIEIRELEQNWGNYEL